MTNPIKKVKCTEVGFEWREATAFKNESEKNSFVCFISNTLSNTFDLLTIRKNMIEKREIYFLNLLPLETR